MGRVWQQASLNGMYRLAVSPSIFHLIVCAELTHVVHLSIANVVCEMLLVQR